VRGWWLQRCLHASSFFHTAVCSVGHPPSPPNPQPTLGPPTHPQPKPQPTAPQPNPPAAPRWTAEYYAEDVEGKHWESQPIPFLRTFLEFLEALAAARRERPRVDRVAAILKEFEQAQLRTGGDDDEDEGEEDEGLGEDEEEDGEEWLEEMEEGSSDYEQQQMQQQQQRVPKLPLSAIRRGPPDGSALPAPRGGPNATQHAAAGAVPASMWGSVASGGDSSGANSPHSGGGGNGSPRGAGNAPPARSAAARGPSRASRSSGLPRSPLDQTGGAVTNSPHQFYTPVAGAGGSGGEGSAMQQQQQQQHGSSPGLTPKGFGKGPDCTSPVAWFTPMQATPPSGH